MKNLGLTQRVTHIENYKENRDSLDQRWWPLVKAVGFMPVPLANLAAEDASAYAQSLNLSAVIITGGNVTPERQEFEIALLDWAIKAKCPVLGICHGLQLINKYFGGLLTPISGHTATRHSIEFCNSWQQLNPREVNSYHDWGILPQNLGTDLQATALHADGTVEAVIHQQTKIAGLMWHPERETPYDLADIELLRSLLV